MDYNKITTVEEWLGEDNEIGINIWKNKYCYNNESFNEWLDRVSNGNEKIRKRILKKQFLFGGRILSNRGLYKEGLNVTYSNCYVIAPPKDNIESIFECGKKLARTFSTGGGAGIDISNLAPRGFKVNNAAKYTSGSVSFIDLFSTITGIIGQNNRRGALMVSLSCEHPDIEEFIELKSDLTKATKANISVRFTDEFMKCAKDKSKFHLKFNRPEVNQSVDKEIDADALLTKMAEMNYNNGEPGALFWDRITGYNLMSNNKKFKLAGVNPCGEEPLPSGGSCLLGAINLSEFVECDKNTGEKYFNSDEFINVVKDSVIALNEVLDEGLPLHPLQEQQRTVEQWRQIGLGIFGLADMLIKMEIKYGSKEALLLCKSIGRDMIRTALSTSFDLGNDGRGIDINTEDLFETDFYQRTIYESIETIFKTLFDHKVKGITPRNSQLLTIAPTGSLSTMLGVSGGIEPIYDFSYTRKTESLHGNDVNYKIYTKIVRDYMEKNNITDEKDLPDYFITAHDIHYKDRINMQAVWQRYIDASISSTVNLPNDITVEDIKNIYIYAWQKGLKGITVYRDGCDRKGVLNSNEDNLSRGHVINVDSNTTIGRKRKLVTGCGNLHCTAFFDSVTGSLLETYLSKGSTGGCNNFMVGLSRLISLSARAGCTVDQIVDQLNSCGVCPSYAVRTATKKDTSKGSCCPVAVANALIDMSEEIKENLGLINKDKQEEVNTNKCPQCSSKLVSEAGCRICRSCGWTRCD